MGKKLAVAVVFLLASISSLAQVQPAATKARGPPREVERAVREWTIGRAIGKMGTSTGWGPSAWATATMWHCLGVNVEGHSMILGGNQKASNYKLFVGEGGLMCTMGYWGRLQPIFKGELGFASLSQPGNGTGQLHSTYGTWAVGGGLEYHTRGHWWARVDYTYDALMDFHSSITNQNHTLNPRGIAFGATYRFGASGTRF